VASSSVPQRRSRDRSGRHPLTRFAGLAIAAWIFAWLSLTVTRSSGTGLALGIEPQASLRCRRRGPPAAGRRRGTAVESTHAHRLVSEQPVCAPTLTSCWKRPRPSRSPRPCRALGALRARRGHVEIALGPGRDDVRDVGGIAAPAQGMVGASERDKALGCFAAAKMWLAFSIPPRRRSASGRSAAPCAAC